MYYYLYRFWRADNSEHPWRELMGEATSSDEEDIFDDPYELEEDDDDIYLGNLNVYEDLDDDYLVLIFNLTSFQLHKLNKL